MTRTPEETALLTALLLRRAGQKRGRISEKTIRRLAKRSQLRRVFLRRLEEHLDDLGIVLVELRRGGYGIMAASALEGAPVVTVKKHLRGDLDMISAGEFSFADIRNELVEFTLSEEDEAEDES